MNHLLDHICKDPYVIWTLMKAIILAFERITNHFRSINKCTMWVTCCHSFGCSFRCSCERAEYWKFRVCLLRDVLLSVWIAFNRLSLSSIWLVHTRRRLCHTVGNAFKMLWIFFCFRLIYYLQLNWTQRKRESKRDRYRERKRLCWCVYVIYVN